MDEVKRCCHLKYPPIGKRNYGKNHYWRYSFDFERYTLLHGTDLCLYDSSGVHRMTLGFDESDGGGPTHVSGSLVSPVSSTTYKILKLQESNRR